ncbi:universal stress protein [Haloquadratum walsbyi]|jgi:Universal stress protein UspA and related nucleotide-binding proteins|nr:universal stress protein [Haloquadratum walsbyi]
MFETILIATDGSESVRRAVDTGLDMASRFDATVHCLYVIDESDVNTDTQKPGSDHDHDHPAMYEHGQEAVETVAERTDGEIITTIERGDPPSVIEAYAGDIDADVIAMGTRGRHGENRFLIGSVAEELVRTVEIPVLTVRQLASDETDNRLTGTPERM